MTPRLLRPGEYEALKTGVHLGLGLLAGMCCAYNAGAWLARREPHLFSNAIVYGLISVLEAGHVRQHTAQQLERRDRDAL